MLPARFSFLRALNSFSFAVTSDPWVRKDGIGIKAHFVVHNEERLD
jgi:hypothetical protein